MSDDIIPLFKALADPERIRIAGLLVASDLTVPEISAIIEMPAPRVVRHVELPRAAGLAEAIEEPNSTRHRFAPQPLHDALKSIATRPEPAPLPGDLAAEDQKILLNFLVGTRLKSIPRKGKKFTVLLNHLILQFEPGHTYAEREVNELLKIYHEDYATLRRGLVDAGLLRRENQQYWRVSAE